VVAYADDRMWRRGNFEDGVFAQAFASEGLCGGKAGQVLREMVGGCASS
jgi:hypothetical protein